MPRKQAAHMAAPTEGQNIKKTLANREPSTQDIQIVAKGPKQAEHKTAPDHHHAKPSNQPLQCGSHPHRTFPAA